ncbi:hypothetical protein BDR03DRAFT_950520 [Suillus americanus]|nr:hypothetical protein BDR03DRAFT_950520 [Suillus americanus]
MIQYSIQATESTSGCNKKNPTSERHITLSYFALSPIRLPIVFLLYVHSSILSEEGKYQTARHTTVPLHSSNTQHLQPLHSMTRTLQGSVLLGEYCMIRPSSCADQKPPISPQRGASERYTHHRSSTTRRRNKNLNVTLRLGWVRALALNGCCRFELLSRWGRSCTKR